MEARFGGDPFLGLIDSPYKVSSSKFHRTSPHSLAVKDFFSKCYHLTDLVIFTEEILNGKLHDLCSVCAE